MAPAEEPRTCQHRAPATGRPACTRPAVYRVSRQSGVPAEQDSCRTHLQVTVDELARGDASALVTVSHLTEIDAAAPAQASRRTVTFDLADASASFVLTEALEEFAARQRDQAAGEHGHEMRERWADMADQMRAQAEAAG